MAAISLIMVISLLLVIWLDLTRYIIPNWLVGSLLLLYPVYVLLAPAPIDWLMALAAFAVVFVVGYILFMCKQMGGGDVKLMAVLALWAGWGLVLPLMINIAMFGGLFTLLLLLARPFALKVGAVMKNTPRIPRVLQYKEPVPYGVGIAAGFFYLLAQGKIPGLSLQQLI